MISLKGKTNILQMIEKSSILLLVITLLRGKRRIQIKRWIYSTSAKDIGIMYIILGIINGIIGVSLSIIIRLELSSPGFTYVKNEEIYNIIVTLHAIYMIFLAIMPILIGGFGNYIMPILIGTQEVSYPRINAISFWLIGVSSIIITISSIITKGAGTGWTIYPPLSIKEGNKGIDLMILGLHIAGISSLIGGINYITTIKNQKIIEWNKLPLFVWTIWFTAILLIISLPFLAVAITIILTDRNLNTVIYDSNFGGDSLLYQHLFWLFGHPEVYILIIPAFGIVSEAVRKTYKKEIFGKIGMLYAIAVIAILGSIVWGHHMYVAGLDIGTKAYFNGATAIIGIPTGIKILSWIATINRGEKTKKKEESNYIIGFIILFTMGGLTGIIISNTAIDIILHDTYYIVGHFHMVLSLGATIGVKIGIKIYNKIMIGWKRNTIIERIEYWVFIIGANITFFPMHYLGIIGMPRRYQDYPKMYEKLHQICTIGAIIGLISTIIYIYIFYEQMSKKRKYNNLDIEYRFKNNKYEGKTLDEVIEIPTRYHTYKNTPLLI